MTGGVESAVRGYEDIVAECHLGSVKDDEVEIEIYETVSGQYVDTTAAISVVEDGAFVPTFRIDVETGKFKDIHQG